MSYAPAAGPSGSRTVTVTGTPSGPSREGSSGPSDQAPPNIGTLRLRGGPDPQYGGSSKGKGKAGEKPKRKGVVWAEEVVDNEGLGKKKSKICCIYHKPRAFDESSSESDCSSDEGHRHAHSARPAHAAKGSGAGLRRGDGGGSQVQESEESSESDGGAGDGRARPVRKGRRAPKHNHSPDGCGGDHGGDESHDHGDPAPNRYDVQPRSGK